MPHQIQITDINIERLQDISDEDCLKEGILFDKWIDVKGFASKKKAQEFKKMLES